MTDPDIEIHYITSGKCSCCDDRLVASDGYVGNYTFSFRASGKRWEFRVADMEYSGKYDNASHMPQYVALELIADCIRRYIEGEQD